MLLEEVDWPLVKNWREDSGFNLGSGMKSIKVSIIIPCFNAQDLIQDCYDSILSQTLKEIELIFIDDGSTDSTLQIINGYQVSCEKVKVIHQENSGAGPARNVGLDVACGEFVCFMDPDDFYPSNDILEKMYEAASRENVDICGGSLLKYTPDGTIIDTDAMKEELKQYSFENDGILYYRDYQVDFYYQRFLYRLSFLNKNRLRFPAYRRFQDPPFFTKAMALAERFYALGKVTYGYRVGQFSKIVWTEEKLAGYLQGMTDILELSQRKNLMQLYNRNVKRLCKSMASTFFANKESLTADFLNYLPRTLNAIHRSLIDDDKTYPALVENLKKVVLSVDSDYDFDRTVREFEANDLIDKISQLEETVLKSQAQLKKANKDNETLQKKLSSIKNSKSFRIGRIITWVPGKIMSAIRKLIRKTR